MVSSGNNHVDAQDSFEDNVDITGNSAGNENVVDETVNAKSNQNGIKSRDLDPAVYDLSESAPENTKSRFNFFGRSKAEKESKSTGNDEEDGAGFRVNGGGDGDDDVRVELRALKKKMHQLEESHAREIQDLKHQVQEEMQALVADGTIMVPHGSGDSLETEKSSSDANNTVKEEKHPESAKTRGGKGGFSFFRTYDKFLAPAEDGSETYLDNDTFTLMMVHKVNTQAWGLGILAYFFEMTLGCLIALDQINLSDGSSVFDVPFNVDNIVRVGQFFSIFLCLSTQTDMLTSVQNIVILGAGSKWDEAIGERNNKSSCLWITRILFPNLLKFSQGLLVMFVSFVIIVQSDNIIDLLKDFTALMVLSETDNIMFHLATQGYLGQTLLSQTANATDRSVDTSGESSTSVVPLGSTGVRRRANCFMTIFNFRPLILVALFAPMLGGWVVIIQNQISGQYFMDKYPKCKVNGNAKEAFELAKKYFGDGVCWGGPLNSFDCEFEDGDCVNFNLAYPLCKGRDELVNVQEKMDNGFCDAEFMISDCDYDGGDCCPYSIINRLSFGDGQCDAISSAMECGFDNGDCNTFNRQFPACPYTKSEELNKIQLFGDPILGNGVCDSGHYGIEECGWEAGDCDPGQIGQDVMIVVGNEEETELNQDALASLFDMSLSLDGMSFAIGDGGQDWVLKDGKPGYVIIFTYDDSFKAWVPRGNRLIGEALSGFGTSKSLSEKGDRLAVGAPNSGSGLGQVQVFDYNPSNDGWIQIGQTIDSEVYAFMGHLVELTADGTRLAVSQPMKSAGPYMFVGEVSVYDLNAAEERWKLVGNPIQGSSFFDVLGMHALKLSSLRGDILMASSGFVKTQMIIKFFKFDQDSQDWLQIGNDFKDLDIEQSAMSADGYRVALGLNATTEGVPGEVVVLDFNETANKWEQVGETIYGSPDEFGNRPPGFGASLSISSDGQVLSIGMIDPYCSQIPLCATGFVHLYLYDPVDEKFMEMINKNQSPYNVLPKRPQDFTDTLLGLDVSLNRDGTSISMSGYDLKNNVGFVRVLDLTRHFFTRCPAKDASKVMGVRCYLDEYPYNSSICECVNDGDDNNV